MQKLEDIKNKYLGFYDGSDPRNNVVCFLRDNALNKPNKIALQWPDPSKKIEWGDKIIEKIPHQSVTFKQFYDAVGHTASGLLWAGVKHGDCVVVRLPMSLYLYQAIFAIMMIGARVVFLDWTGSDQLGVSAKIVNPTAIISFEQTFQQYANIPEITEIPIKIVAGPRTGKYTASLEELLRSPMLDKIEPVCGDETALVTFINGNSEIPLGTDRTHQFIISQNLFLGGDSAFTYCADDIDLPLFPIFFMNNIMSGINTVIPIIDIESPTVKDSLMLVSQIKSCGVTRATFLPAAVTEIVNYCKDKKVEITGIHRIITCGAPVSRDTISFLKKCAPKAEVLVLHCCTAVEPIAYIKANYILKPEYNLAIGNIGNSGMNIGSLVEGLEYRLLKINKNPIKLINDSWAGLEAESNEVGELVVTGLQVCKAYYNNPAASSKSKIIESNGKVWHRTGDIVMIAAKTMDVWLFGRVRNAICRDGKILFPEKVEILLKKHMDVKEAAYIGVPDAENGEKIHAFVSLVDKPKASKEEILELLAWNLIKESIPYDWLDIVTNISDALCQYDMVKNEVLSDENISVNINNGVKSKFKFSFNLVSRKLCEIVEKHSRAVYSDDKRLEGLLNDNCCEHKKEINLIMIAVRCGVAEKMKEHSNNLPIELLFDESVKKIIDHYAVMKEAAVWAAASIALSLNIVNIDYFENTKINA